MSFDPERITFTATEVSLAKEIDEAVEALAFGHDDKVQQLIEAGLAALSAIPTAADKKALLIKVGLALALDNLQEHLFGEEVEDDA